MRGSRRRIGETAGVFTCPRCAAEVSDRYYGPCGACRDDLRARLAGRRREVASPEFEPATHVTPNAVALKE